MVGKTVEYLGMRTLPPQLIVVELTVSFYSDSFCRRLMWAKVIVDVQF